VLSLDLVPSHLSRSRVRRWIGRTAVAAFGWKVEGEPPHDAKCVVIAAPHTSNWDGVYMLAIAWAMGMRISWMGKHTLFTGWHGPVLKALGGIPIDRRARHDVVEQMVKKFAESEALLLAIPPEGKRQRTEQWKSGFYWIAQGAHVPIYMSFLDYGRRVGGVGPSFVPSGDVEADVAKLRAFYAPMKGKFPENFGPIELAPKKADEPKP
jgi:1-acyl-sn-glycerol-3-phosphate acyltransferase